MRADRLSLVISQAQCTTILHALLNSLDQNLFLNRFITVNSEAIGFEPTQIAAMTTKLLKKYNDWLRAHRAAGAYIYIRENSKRAGQHVHILCHVPHQLDLYFGKMPSRWMRQISSDRIPAKSIKTLKIRGAANRYDDTEIKQLYLQNLLRVVEYCLKGVDQKSAVVLGLDRFDRGGQVTGKRVGVSKSIRPAVLRIS